MTKRSPGTYFLKSVFPILAILFATSVTQAQTRVDRFYAEFKVADASIQTQGFDGGAGGFMTPKVPIFAQAVIKVEEGQNLEWEWLGMTDPGSLVVPNFPNVVFDVTSKENQREYRDIGPVDLNPSSPNIWSSSELVTLEYDAFDFDIHYESFSHKSDVSGRFETSQLQTQNKPSSWRVGISRVDYARFPESLFATVVTRLGRSNNQEVYFPLNPQLEIEPKLRVAAYDMFRVNVGDQVFRFTPSGDANNDGKVSFDDFLLLANGFGQQAEAAWADGDFDDDGDVDFTDFLGLAANFGEEAAAASVPEPSSGCLALGLGVSILSVRRRRRRRAMVWV